MCGLTYVSTTMNKKYAHLSHFITRLLSSGLTTKNKDKKKILMVALLEWYKAPRQERLFPPARRSISRDFRKRLWREINIRHCTIGISCPVYCVPKSLVYWDPIPAAGSQRPHLWRPTSTLAGEVEMYVQSPADVTWHPRPRYEMNIVSLFCLFRVTDLWKFSIFLNILGLLCILIFPTRVVKAYEMCVSDCHRDKNRDYTRTKRNSKCKIRWWNWG